MHISGKLRGYDYSSAPQADLAGQHRRKHVVLLYSFRQGHQSLEIKVFKSRILLRVDELKKDLEDFGGFREVYRLFIGLELWTRKSTCVNFEIFAMDQK